jgi:hypothetical protein
MSRNNLKVFNIQYVIPHTQNVYTCKILGVDYQKAENCLRSLIYSQLKARSAPANYNTCIDVTNRSVSLDIDLISDDAYEHLKNENKVNF